MTEKPLVSILMPVYNAGFFLDATMASIISQDYINWELIVVDDFSTDDSAKKIRKYAASDPRIQLYPNKEKGIIPALSYAFSKSTGACITRMDADDLMPPNKLGIFVNSFTQNPSAVITGKVNYFSEEEVSAGYRRYEDWLNKRVEKGDFWTAVYRECVIASPNWLVSRGFFDQVSWDNLVYPEDYDLVFKWYELKYKIVGVSVVTHLWREHPNRTSRKVADYQQPAFFQLKTKRFIELELDNKEAVQLVGAGKKGKMIAEILIQEKVNFQWFDRDSDRYGAPVLGQFILPVSQLDSNKKAILTAWPTEPKQQHAIQAFLEQKGFMFGKQLWLF